MNNKADKKLENLHRKCYVSLVCICDRITHATNKVAVYATAMKVCNIMQAKIM